MIRNKIVGAAAVLFVLFFIAKNPSGAAATAGAIGDGLASLADGVGAFLADLSGGGGSR
jgi:hypothetical protein